VPVLDLELAGYHRGADSVSILHDLVQVSSLLVSDGRQTEIVDHEHIDLGQARELLEVASIGSGDLKAVKESG
jgi:hypothetical protein